MPLYARRRRQAAAQAAGDTTVGIGVLLAVWVGMRVHDLVAGLAAPGREVAEAGAGLARAGEATGDRLADVPLLGPALRRPFELLAEGGQTLVQAGTAQQAAAQDLALLLGLVIAAVPVTVLLGLWLPRRLRWMREAAAAYRLDTAPGGEALLAMRALGSRPLRDLLRAEADPWTALQHGQTRRLAELERAALGLPEKGSRPAAKSDNQARSR